jgi:tetratricopeptide (TPR) repeat protein
MYLAWISRALLLGCLLSAPLAAQQTPVSEASLVERLQKNGQDLAAYSQLYHLYAKQGRRADADQVFLRAVNALPASSFSPNSPRALEIGDFYLSCGKLDLAMKQYQASSAAKPGEKVTYLKRQIEILIRQGKLTEAGELNAQVLRENPDDNDARALAAGWLLDKGDSNGALTELQALAVRAPENPVIHFNLGRVHAARREWDEAAGEFNKAIQLRPDYIQARLTLAQVQLTTGKLDDAFKTAGAVLELDDANTTARLYQSAVLTGQKKYGESRQLLEEALKADPRSADTNFQLGAVNLADKKYPEAEASFRRAYQLNPADARGLSGMVETALAQNQADAALAMIQAEIAKAPNRVDLQLALGNTALRAAKYDVALATFQKVLNQTEKGSAVQGEIYLRIGETYRRMGNTAEAVGALQIAREIVPNNIVVLNTLAMVLEAVGRKPEASEAYAAILKLDPNNAVAMNNLAFVLAESDGDLDRALAMAQRARQTVPGAIEFYDTLGWVYLKKGMLNQAMEIFRELVDKDPTRATYHYHLARVYQLKGDQAGALGEARAAADKHPGDAEGKQIQAMIAQLGGGK